MNEVTKRKKSAKLSTKGNDAFRKRLDDCKLLDVMEKIYKKKYGLSSKRYLATVPLRSEAEWMLKTLESAPLSITEMFQKRLDEICKKKVKKRKYHVWTPTIPVPAIKKVIQIISLKKEAGQEGFMPISPKMQVQAGCFIPQ